MVLISFEYEIVSFVFNFLPFRCSFDSINITFFINGFDLEILSTRGAIVIEAKISDGCDNLMAWSSSPTNENGYRFAWEILQNKQK